MYIIHYWTNICYDIWEERKLDEYPSWRFMPYDIRYGLLLFFGIPISIYSPTSLKIFTCGNLWKYFFLTIQFPVTFSTTGGHIQRGFQRFDKRNCRTTDENSLQIWLHPVYFLTAYRLVQRGCHNCDKWDHQTTDKQV